MSILKRQLAAALAIVLLIGVTAGCAADHVEPEDVFVAQIQMEYELIESEAVALAESPEAPSAVLQPVASGEKVKKSGKAVIDYSNTADGYVMVQYTAQTTKRLKVQLKGPSTTYTYNLTPGKWETFPLSDGNGSYQIALFENVSGSKYALVQSVTEKVTLKDEFAPFLRPNQYVDYSNAGKTVAKAAELTKEVTDP